MSGPLQQQFHSSTSAAFIEQELQTESIAPTESTVELDFFTGAMSVPHPDKVQQGMKGHITKRFGSAGEDAYCVHADKESNCHVLAVADGVFEWSLKGIDAGEYSRSLINHALSTVEENGIQLTSHDHNNSANLLHTAWENVTSESVLGSCTACFTTIDLKQGILDCANLGDSALLVVGANEGDKVLKLRTPAQEHTFGCPYQLGHHDTASEPTDAMGVQFQVGDGDVIVLGTDGLFDNLDDQSIADLVLASIAGATTTKQKRGLGRVMAQTLTKHAFDASMSMKREGRTQRVTPYSIAAQEEFDMIFNGGKKDDITVVVGIISAKE
jgi:protein phosphatase PTC7